MRKILVTGALGQIGSELVPALRDRYGAEQVIATDIRMFPAGVHASQGFGQNSEGPYEHIDCTKMRQLQEMIRSRDVGTIYHLAALLSAVAEEKPQAAWDLNMGGLYRVLEVARECRCAVFFPSSIGAFGPSTPRDGTPQDTTQRPTTMYGVTKVASELLLDYYALRFGLDTRGLRLPGLISYVAPPGGGTTDYAVDIFYQAIQRNITGHLPVDTNEMFQCRHCFAQIIDIVNVLTVIEQPLGADKVEIFDIIGQRVTHVGRYPDTAGPPQAQHAHEGQCVIAGINRNLVSRLKTFGIHSCRDPISMLLYLLVAE